MPIIRPNARFGLNCITFLFLFFEVSDLWAKKRGSAESQSLLTLNLIL